MRKAYQFSAREVASILAAHVSKTTGEVTSNDRWSYVLTTNRTEDESDQSFCTLSIVITSKEKR